MSNSSDPTAILDDSRLTAYALGELPNAAERAEIEQIIAASPEARVVVDEIRALAAALTSEYEAERQPELPSNIVPLSASPAPLRRAWTGHLLRAAAVVVVLGLAVALFSARLAQKSGGQRSAVFAVTSQLRPKYANPVTVQTPASPASSAVDTADKPSTAPLLAEVPTTSAAIGQKKIERQAAGSLAGDASAARALGKVPILGDVPLLGRLMQPRAAGTPGFLGGLAKNGEAAAFERTRRDFDLKSSTNSTSDSTTSAPALASERTVIVNGGATLAIPQTASAPSAAISGGGVSGYVATGHVFASAKTKAVDTDGAFYEYEKNKDTSSGELAKELRPNLEPPDTGAAQAGTASYDAIVENRFLSPAQEPLSTFSIDVDTASYSNVRRFIESGHLPPKNAVRVEEMINYFPYDYAPPAASDKNPFAIHLEAAACPWAPEHRLVRIGIKGREMAADQRPPSNLVFLLDVSGSMMPPERLPLIKASLRLMAEKLTEDDHVAIVVYAGASGLALPSTSGDRKATILAALDRLQAGGSTNGAAGIKLAYQVAREHFIAGGVNRVILATDGDFNVGVTNQSDLVHLIEEKAKGGVFLSVLGVGTDNLQDSTMQKLADHGNGNYAYLDRLEEGRKVLVEQMSGTLVTIAKDVKIQVEFNPGAVAAYRLVGYEKRMLRKEDFNDDRIDAGEIGAGHSVTALYEVVPAGQGLPGAKPEVDALKYQAEARPPATVAAPETALPRGGVAAQGELLTVKIRHKAPDSEHSERSYEQALIDHGAVGDLANASADFKFAVAVASFGLTLRESQYAGKATVADAIELAEEGLGRDAGGYRAGFIEMARKAQSLQHPAERD